MRRNENRFDNYRSITARRDGEADCREGHTVRAGDQIGWHPRLKRVYCADCWTAWRAENAAADADERQGGYGY